MGINKGNIYFAFLKYILSIMYFGTLIYIVFFARRRKGITQLEIDTYTNLIPVRNMLQSFSNSNTMDMKWYFYTNLIGNILLFIPYPIIFILLFNYEKIFKVLLIGVVFSIVIEFMQWLFNIGIPDIDDVLLNILGTIGGILIAQRLKKKYSY